MFTNMETETNNTEETSKQEHFKLNQLVGGYLQSSGMNLVIGYFGRYGAFGNVFIKSSKTGKAGWWVSGDTVFLVKPGKIKRTRKQPSKQECLNND